MGVGETGQIIGETGVGETGVGEMGVIRRKIGQGQHRVTIGTNNKGLRSLILHQNRSSGSWKEDFLLKYFTIYGYGSHLGHVACIMLMNFH